MRSNAREVQGELRTGLGSAIVARVHGETNERLSRREALRRAAVLGALAACAGGVSMARTSGYVVAEARAARLRCFTVAELAIVDALARRLCAADRPGVVSPDEVDVGLFVDHFAGAMRERLRADLRKFLVVIEQLGPLLVGSAERFTRLDDARRDAVLRALESHREPVVRGGFAGLKSLVFMGYYRDPRTWSVLGYEGPWVAAGRGS